MSKDLRLTFSEDAVNYDRWRPRYVPELFDEIIGCANLHSGKRALEIGIGTGQATQPILETGCYVTAVELGKELARYVGKKFSSYPNFLVEQTSFEDFDGGEGGYDLLYSATAFHWIPEELGYPKALNLLKPGGALALFWNHPAPGGGEDMQEELQEAYRRYWPGSKKPAAFQASDCDRICVKLRQYGFSDVQAQLFSGMRTLSGVEYVALLNTYSDHRAMPEAERLGLERKIMAVILRYGGAITICDTMDLYLAKRPL